MVNVARIGKQYEDSIKRKIKTIYGVSISSAGFTAGPDIVIPSQKNPGKNILVEVKTSTAADFGQKGITFDGFNWIPKFQPSDTVEMIGLYDYLYKNYSLSDKIKEVWKLPNSSLTSDDLKQLVETENLPRILYYEKILKESEGEEDPFPTKTIASGKSIVDDIVAYYNSKGVHYIQIKGSGFYIMGEDVMGLNSKIGGKIPKFNPSSANIIVRAKPYPKSKVYKPTLTLKSGSISRSNYNLDDVNFIKFLNQNI